MTSLGQLLSLITNEHILNTIPGYLRQKEREENPEVWQRVTAENRGRFADSCSLWHSVVLHCLTGVGEHFPPRLVLVHCPTGLSHFITHHIANFTPAEESCPCSLKYPCWKGCAENLLRPFVYTRAAADCAQIKTEKIQTRLPRSGKMRSQLTIVPILTLPSNSGEYGIWKGE